MEEVRDFLRSRGRVTLALTAVNVLVFLVLEFLGDTENGTFILEHGGAYTPWILERGEYYRLLTAMFLHFGLEHLFSNMLVLLFLGDMLEKMTGSGRYVLIYFLGGLAGNLLSVAHDLSTGSFSVSAGASGAVFAVLGALVFLVVRHRGRIPGISGKRLLLMTALTLADGFLSPGIDAFAHLGGLAAGFLLALLLIGKKPVRRVSPRF